MPCKSGFVILNVTKCNQEKPNSPKKADPFHLHKTAILDGYLPSSCPTPKELFHSKWIHSLSLAQHALKLFNSLIESKKSARDAIFGLRKPQPEHVHRCCCRRRLQLQQLLQLQLQQRLTSGGTRWKLVIMAKIVPMATEQRNRTKSIHSKKYCMTFENL